MLTRPVRVRKDPRLKVTDDDLRAQFEFLVRVRDKITQVHDGVLDVREIRVQVQQWVSRTEGLPGSGALAGAAKELNSELDRIEDALIQWRAEAFEDTFHYPVRLNNQLATIADLTNMASSAPTHQMLTLYAELQAKADAHLDRLENVKHRECTTFGDALRELGIPDPDSPERRSG